MTNRLIIVGSPRIDGRSAALADLLFESCIETHPDEEVSLAPVSTLSLSGCMGCNACKEKPQVQEDEELLPCVIQDDMQELYPLIDAADELIIVSPVYFAGAPSQLKALLDRFQPYYWTDARSQKKRSATLHVVGEGNDPHGFDALITTVKSALAVAGFQLDTVMDWVGRLDESGEILEEAKAYDLRPKLSVLDESPVIDLEAAAAQAAAMNRSGVRAIAGGKQQGKGKGKGGNKRQNGSADQPKPQVDSVEVQPSGKARLSLGANGSKPAAPDGGNRGGRGGKGGGKKGRGSQGKLYKQTGNRRG